MNECSVCFETIHPGNRDQNLCSYRGGIKDGPLLHPVTQLPVSMCNCGLAWNQECSFKGLGFKTYKVDEEYLKTLKTPTERRKALLSGAATMEIDDGKNHFPIKNARGH